VPTDHLLNAAEIAGSLVTGAGVVIGGVVTLVYGRKVNAQIEAELHVEADGSIILSTRPSIHAVGFRGMALGDC